MGTTNESVKNARTDNTGDGERKYTFRTIDVDHIQAYNNIRKSRGDDDLVASIRAHGIINPLTVVQDTGMATYYRLIAGFRRYEAAKKLGIKKLPCHVVDKEESLNELSLSENVSRMDMTPYEECIAVRNLVDRKNTIAQIAKRFGRTVRWVLVRKKLADAGDKVLKKLKNGEIQLSAAARLAELPDDVFKEELEDISGNLSDWDIKNILERNRMDLEKAPFDHSACLKCSKCSVCQKDLFDDDPKPYCLDSDCWEKKVRNVADEKAEGFRKDGFEAIVGYGYENTVDEIRNWEKDLLKQAEESGIKKRVIVNPDTCKEVWYYSKKDLPDYHEETEEEREKERKDYQFRSTKEDMTKSRIRKAIKAKIEKDGDKDDIIALLLFCVYDLDDTIHESQFDVLGIKKNIDECIGFSDIDDQVRPCDIHDAILGSVEHILGRMYDIDTLRKMYSIITYGNPKDAEPVDDEVEDEITRIHEKKNEENNQSSNEDSNEDSEDKEDDDE